MKKCIYVFSLLFFYPLLSYAQYVSDDQETPAEKYSWISFYKPTYVLPYYYTQHPDQAVYKNNTSNNEEIKRTEAKYQLSFKIPVWADMVNKNNSLDFGYTQLSYWQVYNHDSFFRETDYSPELFFSHSFGNPTENKEITPSVVKVGLLHQSNGAGGDEQRSWNRAYVELVSSFTNWMFSLKPWYIFHDLGSNNPDIGYYLGHEEITVAYEHKHYVWSLMGRNTVEHGGNKAALEFTWSFPLTNYIKGYVQVFSGYGQSLIEYDHRTNAIGVGIALNDWL